MDENTRKPGQTAEILGVTPMTLRNYQKKFAPVLSERATAKTARMYTPEDIAYLQRASDLLRQGFTYEQTLEQLKTAPPEPPLTGDVLTEDVQPETIDEPEPETTSQDEPIGEGTPSAIMSLEFYSQVIEQLTEEHKTALTAKDSHISELKSDKERLQRQLNYERLPWFKKWFTDPPE